MVWQTTKIRGREIMGVIAALGLAVPAWSCANTDAYLGDLPKDQILTPSADAASGADSGAGDGGMCIATDCPEGLTTCPSEFGPTYACSVDLRRDQNHCGACGHACITMEPLHMTSRCVDGACELECLSPPRPVHPDFFFPTSFQNCNGVLDDGCEVDVLSDDENCGACGNACPADQHCFEGQCGCPNGLQFCNGACRDLSEDDENCKQCGHYCQWPDPACDPMPAHTGYGCMANDCGQLKCEFGFADCNTDLGLGCASNGCETPIDDVNNCGACGNVCKPDEVCRFGADGNYECAPTCEKLGLKSCEGGFCADTLNDADHCGGCGLACPLPGPHQLSACKKGLCEVACAEGFGDCNGDPTDGCEVDLRVHPQHCGACGAACDLSLGQPCVEGKCLMGPCEGEATR